MDLLVFDTPLHLLGAMFYAMPRLLAMFSMIPLLSKQALPGLLRSCVVMAFAVFIVPTLIDHVATQPHGVLASLGVVIKEVVLGMALGLIAAIPLWAFEAMGAFVDNQRGASIAQMINPLTGHDSSPLGELFSQAAITWLIASGGLFAILAMAYASFEIWPVFSALPQLSSEMPSLLLSQLDRLMRLAVLLGAPVLIAMFLAEMGLALVSRFAPQMQVFFLAMGVKSAVAMFVFAVYAAALFEHGGVELVDVDAALRAVSAMFEPGRR